MSSTDSLETHKKHKNLVKNILLLVFGLLVIAAIVIATIHTTRTTQNQPNKRSVYRIQQINEILIGLFGRRWPYVLIFTFLLILVILGITYQKIAKYNPVINLSDHASKVVSFCAVGLFILILILVVINFVHLFLKSPKENGNVDDYTPDDDKKTKEILLLIGLIIVGILVLIGVLGFLHKIFQNKR